MWSINVKFLRGVCVATDTGQWDESEWPPHPARLFMAMAAAYFETRQFEDGAEESAGEPVDDSRRAALEWLEQQPAPVVLASEAMERDAVTVFVPVNDSTRADQLFAETRSRQPRHFPTRIPDNDTIHYLFDGALPSDVADSLHSIASEVVRIGHSSSLTQVWIDAEFAEPVEQLASGELLRWSPAGSVAGESEPLRVFSHGMLKALEANYNEAAIERYAALQLAIGESKGSEKTKLKGLLAEEFPSGEPTSNRPQSAIAIPYQKTTASANRPASSHFDSDLMVLTFDDAPTIGLESTLQLAGAVRKKMHDAFPNRTSPEWLGGHRTDGSPSADPHLAIIPLPFVDHRFADGHLLGIALIFPKHVAIRDRAIVLRQLFERSEAEEDWILRLRLNEFRRLTGTDSHRDITLRREQRLSPPRTLDLQTWTKTCSVWETVTPIVLDRFPKSDRQNDRAAWQAEVSEIISSSCENVGLPRPFAVHAHHNSFVEGVPKSKPGGGGFPPMKAREGKPTRFQIHARIEFDVPVHGPVLLGAGRFVGYGFCKPNISRCRKRRGF